MNKTFKERLMVGLVALGWQQVHSRTGYAEFAKDGVHDHVFVGPNGALRAGPCASRSYSIGDPGRQTAKYKTVLDAGTPKEEVYE